MVLSDRGSLPATERSWILRRHSQRILIGAFGVQIVAMLAQLHSSSACMMEMCEHDIDTDVGKAEDVIIKSGEIDAINNGKDLFLISSVMVMAVASCLRQVS